MADRKFFSGLTDKMMTKNTHGRNHQQTNFYWPNETDTEQFTPSRNRLRSRSASNASLMSQSQASTDTEESRRRRNQHNQSKIEFYDMVDVGTDDESIYSRSAGPNKHKKQETLKSRIEFYDFVDTHHYQPDDDVESVIERPISRTPEPSVVHNNRMTSENGQKVEEKPKVYEHRINIEKEPSIAQSMQNLNLSTEPKNGHSESHVPVESSRKKVSQPYIDSFSESDDDDERSYYRSRNQLEERRYAPPQPKRYPPPPRSIRSHPRRSNSEYLDFDDDEYDRSYDSSRRPRYRKPENVPRMVKRRDYSPEMSDEDYYDNVGNGYRRSMEYSRPRLPPQPDRYGSHASRLDDNESLYRGKRNRRPANGYGSERDFDRNSSRQSPVRRSPPMSQTHNNQSEAPVNGYASEMEPRMPTSARPPIKPLTRTNSINEARQRQLVNLKSNIFHTDPEYNSTVEHRKPTSIREFAAGQRVGVGLPDI